ncbi:MAG: hypothetical protein EOO77_08150 [Oxalobacteraceae bacterium]|nr:MAG: hypothetical protein EOO77_08150 [Oxalobacteraceae bacterium]
MKIIGHILARTACVLSLSLFSACQMSNPQGSLSPGAQTIPGVTASQTVPAAAAVLIRTVVDSYTFAADRQGMAGVIAAIDECYRGALAPNKRPADVRTCMVLDMMAFRIDQQVSGGAPGNDRQLPYFQRAKAAQRWERYAPLGNLQPGQEAASFMMNGSEVALMELNRRRAAPRVS